MSNKITIKQHFIPALVDGWPLNAFTVLPPIENASYKPAVVMAPATGVPIKTYLSFFKYLAHHGHPVVGFDYRMCGGSWLLPGGAKASGHFPKEAHDGAKLSHDEQVSVLKEWQDYGSYEQLAYRDYAAVLKYAWEELSCNSGNGVPTRELVAMGNSLGGFLTPIVTDAIRRANNESSLIPGFRLARALFISSCSGYWGYSMNPDVYHQSVNLIIEDAKQEGYMDSIKWNLGNNITKAQCLDWMAAIKSPSWYGAFENFAPALHQFDVPLLSVAFSDDQLLVQGSARRADAILRPIGHPFLEETEEEKAYWEGEDGDTVGKFAYKKGPPPRAELSGRTPNVATVTRILLDVKHNNWISNSKQAETAGEQSVAPPEVGHINWCRPAVGNPASPSFAAWEILRAWIDERAEIPSSTSPVLGGCGGRRDFGPEAMLNSAADIPETLKASL